MASIQFISGKICYNRKNYFKEVLMESTVFTNLRGSEGALTFNFFCESLITSLHTLTHVMEDAGLAVPDNVGDIAVPWEKWAATSWKTTSAASST